MARHSFGGDLASWTVTAGTGTNAGTVTFATGATVTFWSAEIGGTQYTNLLAGDGTTAIDHVVTGDGTTAAAGSIPAFYGPDDVWTMWASANGGSREMILATDLADYVGRAPNLGVYVTEYGAVPDGVTPSAAGINAAIAASQPGDALIFPGGTYLLEATVLLKADRAYLASGAVTLKQQNYTELDSMVAVDPAEPLPRRNILWSNIWLDGNAVNPDTGSQTYNNIYTSGSNYAKNRGMVLKAVQFSNFFGLAIRHCGNDGLVLRGADPAGPRTVFNEQTSTNHFVSPYIYGNGRHGIYFDQYSDDNHVFGGDIGDNNYSGCYFIAGSSSLRSCTVWGSRYSHGIVVGSSSNQIIGCQVEGHAQHGIWVTDYGSYTYIAACKVYYNSASVSGAYDGINVNGTSAVHQPKYTTITGNYIYAGIGDFFLDANGNVDASQWRAHRHAITLDTYSSNTVVAGNNVQLSAAGAVPSTGIQPVYGLKAGDEFNGLPITTAGDDNARLAAGTLVPGVIGYQTDTGLLRVYTQSNNRVEHLLRTGIDYLGGVYSVAADGLTSYRIDLPYGRPNQQYVPMFMPSWNTNCWLNDKQFDHFLVMVDVPGAVGDAIHWMIHSYAS